MNSSLITAQPASRSAWATLRSVLFGASSGAALAVLYGVYIGVPAIGPLAFVLTIALIGGVIGALVAGRLEMRRPLRLALTLLWLGLVLYASVFVVAAIALSNFE